MRSPIQSFGHIVLTALLACPALLQAATSSAVSPAFTVDTRSSPVIDDQPDSCVVRAGTNAVFSIAAHSAMSMTYRWQHAIAGGEAWTDISDDATYSGAASATLTVLGAGSALNGEKYRCVVSSGGGYEATSEVAALTVHEEASTTFAGWAAGVFTAAQLGDPNFSGPLADPGATGASNLLRYAFDLPAPGTPLTGPVAPVTLVPFGGANYLSMAIHRKSYDPTLRYIVEGSSDLANWTMIETLVAGYLRDVAVRDTVATSAAARRFLRLRVEIVP